MTVTLLRKTIGNQSSSPAKATTDKEGRFQFKNVEKGDYAVAAFAPGFITGSDGSLPLEFGKKLIIAEGEDVNEIDPVLRRGSVITGRVMGENKQPIIAIPSPNFD